MSGDLAPRLKAVHEFLDTLAPDTARCLTVIREKNALVSKNFAPGDKAGVDRFIARYNGREKGNIYITPGVVSDDFEDGFGKKPKDEDIIAIRAIYCDVDVKQSKPETKKQVASLLETFDAGEELPQPSIVVQTGDSGGIHAWWIMRKPVSIMGDQQQLDKLRNIGRSLMTKVNGDSTFAPSHLMRVPGCVNYPTEKKIENEKRKPALSKTLTATENRFKLAEIERAFPPLEVSPSKAGTDAKPLTVSGKQRRDMTDHLRSTGAFKHHDLNDYLRENPEVAERLDAACEDDRLLDDMIRRGADALIDYNEENGTELDASSSGLLQNTAFRLRMARFKNDKEIADILFGLDADHDKSNYFNELSGAVIKSRSVQMTMGEAFIPSTRAEDLPGSTDGKEERRLKKEAAVVASLLAEMEAAVEYTPGELVPPRRILMPHYYIGMYSVLAAPGGTGKSSLSMLEAVSIHTGKDLLELGHKIVKRNALIINGEDNAHEISLRLNAIQNQYGLTDRAMAGIGRMSGRMRFATQNAPLTIMQRDDNGRIVENKPVVQALKELCKKRRFGVLYLDPATSLLGVEMNDNAEVAEVGRILNRLADECELAVMVVHHTRKGDGKGDANISVDNIRGASALVDHARSARVLIRMTKKEALAAGLNENAWREHIRVDEEGAKTNLMPAGLNTKWLQLVGVKVDTLKDAEFNEKGIDKIQVVVPSETPVQAGVERAKSSLEDMSASQRLKILEAIKGGQSEVKKGRGEEAGGRAVDAVIAVMGMDVDDKADVIAATGFIKKLVNDKWLTTENVYAPGSKNSRMRYVVTKKAPVGRDADLAISREDDADEV